LEQVSELFADHADLLKEFTYFLPDAVQEQAKERLSRAARESELRRLRQTGAGMFLGTTGTADESNSITRQRTSVSGKNVLVPFLAKSPIEDDNIPASTWPRPSTVRLIEYNYLGRVKEAFKLAANAAGGGGGWAEFLKCLDLFSQDLLKRFEALLLITNLFESHGLPIELVLDIKNFIQNRDNAGDGTYVTRKCVATSKQKTENSLCPAKLRNDVSPSYSECELMISDPQCSRYSGYNGRTLNDVCVSKPLGSELANAHGRIRTYHHEELLFKCEDQQYDIDAILDATLATISVLQSIVNRMQGGAVTLSTVSFLDSFGLRPSHLNAIMHAYGEHGIELVELLIRNPVATIPVILNRLRSKCHNWYRAQSDLLQYWKRQQGSNYALAADRHSFCFHLKEQNNLLMRHLVQEIIAEIGVKKVACVPVVCDCDQSTNPAATVPSCSCIQLHLPLMHETLLEFIVAFAQRSAMSHEEKITSTLICTNFLVPIFGIPMPLSMSGGCGNVMSTTTLLDLSPGERDAIANYLQNENQVDQISFCIGNKHVYVFLRLYNHLLERIYLAYNLCKLKPTNREYVAVSEMLLCRCCQPHSTAAKAATASFNSFLSAVYGLMDGSVDNVSYGQCCVHIFGTKSYLFRTFDKLLLHILKQLQFIIRDKTSRKLIALWLIHKQNCNSTLANDEKAKGSINASIRHREQVRCMLPHLDLAPESLYAISYDSKEANSGPKVNFTVKSQTPCPG